MNSQISTSLRKLNITINEHHIHGIEKLVVLFATRREHPLALNTMLLGTHPIAFTDADREGLFKLFDLDEHQIVKIIQTIPTVNKEFKVASDAFNILAIWIMHLGYTQIHDHKLRDTFVINVAKYFHYKLFTSLVNHYFVHGSNEKIMTATINSLSKKFDIVVYGTWGAVLEARCIDLISPDSIHLPVFERADNDKSYLYAVTDIQTRIRDRIKNIWAEYAATRDRGDVISSTAAVNTDDKGDKLLVHTTATLEILVTSLRSEVLVARSFIDHETMDLVLRRFSNLPMNTLKDALLAISELATSQIRNKQFDKVLTLDDMDIYVGMGILITNIIQKSYRWCIRNKVDINNRGLVFIRILNVYASSRIADKDVAMVKESVVRLIDTIGITKREATKSSLRLAIILYFIVRSFKYL